MYFNGRQRARRRYLQVLQLAAEFVNFFGQLHALLLRLLQQGRHIVQLRLQGGREELVNQ